MTMILHISDGGKGGVGKSTTANALVNYLSSQGGKVLIIETDTQNPDVIRCTANSKRKIAGLYADLRTEDGWNDLLELIEANAGKIDHAVMSLPGADLNTAKYVPLTQEVCQACGVDIFHYFTINRQLDSLNLLAKSVNDGFASIATRRAVVMNGLNGERSKFERWDESDVKAESNAVEIYLPELYWKTQDAFAQAGTTYGEFADSAKSPLLKSRVSQWTTAVNAEFAKMTEELAEMQE
jgi:hypothetical protein